jgi:hypothetical protein
LRGIRYREGKKTKTYLRNPPGSSPKGHVTETDRQRGIKTYKGEMAMRKALNNDPHTSSLASGNLSNDNSLKRKAEKIVDEIVNLQLPQDYPHYGRSTAFQSPTDNAIYNTDRQNGISGLSNNMNNYNHFQSPNEWVSNPSNNMNNNNNKYSSKYSILILGLF